MGDYQGDIQIILIFFLTISSIFPKFSSQGMNVFYVKEFIFELVYLL